MKILQVIHGYPPRYNAGSEVYTQTLAQGLAERHEVQVFTREENPYAPDYAVREEADADDPRVKLTLVNLPRSRDRYCDSAVDERFGSLLDGWRPDIVHIGHLNHVSTSVVWEAAKRGMPVVYTLHDYWLMCPRGQFIQFRPENPDDLWALCDGQEDRKCAERCYARSFSGSREEWREDSDYWTSWVSRRMKHMRDLVERVDLFIAPARYLLERYRDDFHIPEAKLTYLDYGFDLDRLSGRSRVPGEPFTFGYIGRHVPAKGIHHLLEAFGRLKGDARLRIWGRPDGHSTSALQRLAAEFPPEVAKRIEWLPEYRNQAIVSDVFDHVDAIMVPSIWVENSPLVIHEAQQARIPVITANAGGMAEYVQHERNGLLFAHRDPASLAEQMQRMLNNPTWAAQLGARGYLHSEVGQVPSLADHARAIERLYEQVIAKRRAMAVAARPAPWRITLDTNPDDCNLRCIMCEEHSIHSTRQSERRANGKPKRRMTLKLVRKVITEAASLGVREIIPSTMGEPLMYEHFEEIVRLCAAHGIRLNLTTNGTFIGKGAHAWAEIIVPVTSDVKISFNGASARTQQRIMVGTRQDKVLQNVRDFIAVRDRHAAQGGDRCRVTFQLTFLESNVGELGQFVKLAASLGVDRVKGHHLWAHFDQIKPLSMRRSPESIQRWNRAVDEAREAARQHPLPNGGSVLLENIFPLDENAQSDMAPDGACPFLGQEAWVNAEGRFDPCCAPDADRLTLGRFGDLNSQSLKDIWHGEAYRGLVAGYATRALCQTCNMRKPKGA